jgi:hypothetical protein
MTVRNGFVAARHKSKASRNDFLERQIATPAMQNYVGFIRFLWYFTGFEARIVVKAAPLLQLYTSNPNYL